MPPVWNNGLDGQRPVKRGLSNLLTLLELHRFPKTLCADVKMRATNLCQMKLSVKPSDADVKIFLVTCVRAEILTSKRDKISTENCYMSV